MRFGLARHPRSEKAAKPAEGAAQGGTDGPGPLDPRGSDQPFDLLRRQALVYVKPTHLEFSSIKRLGSSKN
jgi:hypothetical protein